MPSGEIVPAALALAALIGVVVVGLLIRRSARGLARVRRRGDAEEVFARIARDVDEELDIVVRRVEAVRRDEVAPGEIITLLSEAVDALDRGEEAVKTLALTSRNEADRQAFLLDLMHAKTALESILDACLELEGSTHADRRDRAPTVMKWGHLNLVRAQQDLAEHVLAHESVSRTGVTP